MWLHHFLMSAPGKLPPFHSPAASPSSAGFRLPEGSLVGNSINEPPGWTWLLRRYNRSNRPLQQQREMEIVGFHGIPLCLITRAGSLPERMGGLFWLACQIKIPTFSSIHRAAICLAKRLWGFESWVLLLLGEGILRPPQNVFLSLLFGRGLCVGLLEGHDPD